MGEVLEFPTEKFTERLFQCNCGSFDYEINASLSPDETVLVCSSCGVVNIDFKVESTYV